MNETDGNPSTKVALFQKRAIRRAMHNNEWWFVIVDVVAVLTNSPNPSGYLRDMRRREPSLAEALKGGGQFAPPLALEFARQADHKSSSAGTPRASFV
jgi:prophage antirepressor-like protein